MKYTERERELLNNWPTVTEQDLERMNDLFSHYLFFRRVNTLGLRTIDLRASCCGHRETRPELVRTEMPEHRELLDHLRHKEAWTCPWCGRKVTMIDLNKAGKRKRLVQTELTLLLHADGEALYADALALQKNYADDAALTARPTAWSSSGYRFVKGEVMQADYQVTYRENEPYITDERDKLSRRKEVQEPFKFGSLCWYQHQSYRILNREALEEHPFFRYCGFFNRWEYRIGGGRGYKAYFSDFVSYLTAYSIYPRQMEMLSKAGYWKPIWDLIFDRKKNAAAMCWEEENPKKAFGLDKQELAWLMGVQPPLEVLAIRNYVRRHWGKTWSLPFCMDFCNLWGGNLPPMEVLRFAKRYNLDLGRLLRYFGGVFDEDHIEMVTYLEQMLAAFNDWFDGVRDILGEDEAGNLLLMIQTLSYTTRFTASDWVAGEGECTLTIPAATHKMTGNVVTCRAFSSASGVYRPGSWAALETYATAAENGDIVLHYPDTSGYDGQAVLSMYTAPDTPSG